jgi:hypothetical protein
VLFRRRRGRRRGALRGLSRALNGAALRPAGQPAGLPEGRAHHVDREGGREAGLRPAPRARHELAVHDAPDPAAPDGSRAGPVLRVPRAPRHRPRAGGVAARADGRGARGAARVLRALDRPACGVVVGTSKLEKNWAPERYARLLEALERLRHAARAAGRAGAGRAQRPRTGAARDAGATGGRAGDDVRRLLWLLDGSALVISPDTGPLHIARALDRPVVGLYGYTNPKRYGPYAGRSRWWTATRGLPARTYDLGRSTARTAWTA